MTRASVDGRSRALSSLRAAASARLELTTERRVLHSLTMAAYFFASPVDVDVKLEGEDDRKKVKGKEKEHVEESSTVLSIGLSADAGEASVTVEVAL